MERLPIIRWLGTLGAVLMLGALSSVAFAGQNVTLAWDPSADTSVAGYILRYGIMGGGSTNSLDVASQTTATISNLNAGTTEFFFVTAYNAQRVESVPSNLITYTVPGTNTPPTISTITDQTVNEDIPTGAISFTVGDAETVAGSLTMSGSSSNPTLVPNGNIVFGGSGANRTVTVSPAANQSGTATITLAVNDGQSSASRSFVLTVNPVNDPPTISSIANKTINMGGTTGPIAFTVGDAETAAGSLTVSGSSSNPTLVPNSNVVFGGSGANRSVTVTPATNQSGTATITATVSDGTASASRSFVLTVSVVSNTPPTISSIPDQLMTANTTTLPIPFAISDVETPAASLTLSKSSSNPLLVPNNKIRFGGSGANRTLTITPATNQSGTATITVSVSDGSASASKSFLLTVNPAAAPTFVYLPLEAESATLVAPMAIAADPNAGQGQFIGSSAVDSGTATFTANIPVAGVYFIWSRVLSPDEGLDSLYVSVDGGAEDIYDTAKGTWTNAWQWTVLNGRGGVNSTNELAINPRTFVLSAGQHSIRFRGREPGTGLDQVLLTNDPDIVPDVIFSVTAPPFRLSSIENDPTGSVTLTWSTVPGNTYRVFYKTNLADSAWRSLGQDIIANDTTASRADYRVGNRFYRILQLP